MESSTTTPGPGVAVGRDASEPPDLDLAFSSDLDLAPELQQAGGIWLDSLKGAERWHGLLSSWLGQLAAELPPEMRAPAYSLGLSLVGDPEIATLNAEWRGQAGPTDVLAFAALDEGLAGTPPMPGPSWLDSHDEDIAAAGPKASPEPLELGDIVISVDTAARQAPAQGHTLEQELQFLASHGLLHLLGWDHPEEASLTAMLERQQRLLTTPGQAG